MKSHRNGQGRDRDAERARWVDRYRSSGLGLKQFAARHGLSAGRLHYWVYGSPKGGLSESPVPLFREVRLPASLPAHCSWGAEVVLANGTTVRLVEGTDVAWTLGLVEALRRPCSP